MKSTKQKVYPFFATETSLDMFLDWASANPALFDERYPELSPELTKAINKDPELSAAMLEKLPELFPKWLENADERIGSARVDELKHIAILLYSNFINKVYDHPIVEHSGSKIEPLAIEYFEIVKMLIDPRRTKERRLDFSSEEKFKFIV